MLLPAVSCVWEAFARLARGRQFTVNGDPLPITYRDVIDEATRCGWPDKGDAEKMLCAMDDYWLALARQKAARENG